MKNELLKCKYCGGTLSHVKFHEWKCDYCGNSSIISNENDIVKCILNIVHNTTSYDLEMINECSIVSNYRKRATMADKYPMFLEIISGNESHIIEPVENIGKGIIRLIIDVDCIRVAIEGKIKVIFNNAKDRDKYLDIGSSMVLGSTGITVKDCK